ncbi:MAG: dienelactone hydrolase family protein [Proteobacteria bacterium]|nr:dienelactone hydrolase family protein [Pseudomonadota bacterium]
MAAAVGPPAGLVVLLHGWGADGNDLIGLAGAWRAVLPRAAFVAPDAPEPHPQAPGGRQWFGLGPDIDLGGPRFVGGAVAAAAAVNDFVDRELRRLDLAPGAVAFVGFSQGGTVALEAALSRAAGCAAVVAYSGALAGGRAPVGCRPPVLLVHGERDDVVPPELLGFAAAAVAEAGCEVETRLTPGLGHGIDEDGAGMGGAFLVRHLSGIM